MPTHSETRELPYTAQQMYDLVADVGDYPKFLPWTSAARIKSVTDKGDHSVMDADLVISFKVFYLVTLAIIWRPYLAIGWFIFAMYLWNSSTHEEMFGRTC